MNKHTAFARISLLFASILGSINIASGNWFITDGEIDNASASASIPVNSSQSGKAVCYIKETGIYYTSLDKALDVAEGNSSADTICVIPNLGFDVAIAKSHVIESGDSLVLPYAYYDENKNVTYYIACDFNYTTSGSAYGKQINGDKKNEELTFADQSEDSVKTYRQTQVVLESNVKLKVEGSLLVAGKLSNPDTGVSGQTAGSYCEITLGANASIVCDGGNMRCDGYIKRSSKNNNSYLQVKGGGKLTSPLVIYDYKNGSCTFGAVMPADKTDKFCPFYVFDFPNIQTLVQIDYGSYWIGNACLYALSAFKQMDICFIAPSSDSSLMPLFIQKSGSITVEYIPANDDGFTTNEVDGTKTNINIDGEVDMGGISFSCAISATQSVSIDSADFYFPISYRLSLSLKKGSVFNASKKIKFLTGSSVLIEEGATLNIGAPLAIYDKFTDNSSGHSYQYPSNLAAASFTNNGIVNVYGDGAIGGFVNTTVKNSSAELNYGTDCFSISSPEASAFTGSGTKATATTTDYTFEAKARLYDQNAKNFSTKTVECRSYGSTYSNETNGWVVSKVFLANIADEEPQNIETGKTQVQATSERGNTNFKFLYEKNEKISVESAENDPTIKIIKNSSTEEQLVTIVAIDKENDDEKGAIVVVVPGRLWEINDLNITVKTNPANVGIDETAKFENTDAVILSSTASYQSFYSKTACTVATAYEISLSVKEPEGLKFTNTTFWWYIASASTITNERIKYRTDTAMTESSKSWKSTSNNTSTVVSTNHNSIFVLFDEGTASTKYVTVKFMAITTNDDKSKTSNWPTDGALKYNSKGVLTSITVGQQGTFRFYAGPK